MVAAMEDVVELGDRVRAFDADWHGDDLPEAWQLLVK